MVRRDALIGYCDERLRATAFQDAGVNGLQVEGRAEIRRLAVAVSTSRVTLSHAVEWDADALLVHHGILWGGRLGPLTGILAARLRLLFQHDLNLIAYHLPLDAHPEVGNNVLLARALGLDPSIDADRFGFVGNEPLGIVGGAAPARTVAEIAAALRQVTDREPVLVGETVPSNPVRRAGILSGSGSSAVQEVVELGCQLLVTGDVREPTMAEAREHGIAVLAGGHEATERLGVQALARELADRFDVETRFIADPNPV
jgi:dinuclear metal center YbgI/SA1388 family protein